MAGEPALYTCGPTRVKPPRQPPRPGLLRAGYSTARGTIAWPHPENRGSLKRRRWDLAVILFAQLGLTNTLTPFCFLGESNILSPLAPMYFHPVHAAIRVMLLLGSLQLNGWGIFFITQRYMGDICELNAQ